MYVWQSSTEPPNLNQPISAKAIWDPTANFFFKFLTTFSAIMVCSIRITHACALSHTHIHTHIHRDKQSQIISCLALGANKCLTETFHNPALDVERHLCSTGVTCIYLNAHYSHHSVQALLLKLQLCRIDEHASQLLSSFTCTKDAPSCMPITDFMCATEAY